jgi:chromosome 9 SCAF14729, whole genome shotgun sequence. (fragment)
LIISSVTDHHQGEYICTASNVFGSHSARALLTLKKSLLEVKIEPHRSVISRGRDAQFRCIVKGNQNSMVAWIRIHRNLTERHKLKRDVLVIEEAEESDQGIYLCRAPYSGGFVQALAILMIKKIEEPLIEITPASSQLVSLGESAYFECHVLSGQ